MDQKKKIKIGLSSLSIALLLLGYQNCTPQEEANFKKTVEAGIAASEDRSSEGSSVSSSSVFSPKASFENTETLSDGSTWTHKYNETTNTLEVSYSHPNWQPRGTGSYIVDKLGTFDDRTKCDDKFHTGTDRSNGQNYMLMISTCLEEGGGRIYTTHHFNYGIGFGNVAWTDPSIGHSVICYREPCAKRTVIKSYVGAGGSLWTHYFSEEENGDYRVFSTRYNHKLYPWSGHNGGMTIFSGSNPNKFLNTGFIRAAHAGGTSKPFVNYMTYNLNESGRSVDISHQVYFSLDDSYTSVVDHGTLNF